MKPLIVVLDSADIELEREFMSPVQTKAYIDKNTLREMMNASIEVEGIAYGLHYMILENMQNHEILGHVCMPGDPDEDQLNIKYTCVRFIPTERALVEIMTGDYANFIQQLKNARLSTLQ